MLHRILRTSLILGFICLLSICAISQFQYWTVNSGTLGFDCNPSGMFFFHQPSPQHFNVATVYPISEFYFGRLFETPRWSIGPKTLGGRGTGVIIPWWSFLLLWLMLVAFEWRRATRRCKRAAFPITPVQPSSDAIKP